VGPCSSLRRRRLQLECVPSIAANGGVTVWLWMISLILFFWPQGIAVIELLIVTRRRRRLSLAKEVSATSTVFSPLVLLDEQHDVRSHGNALFVGVSVFVLGEGIADWRTTRLSR